MFLREADTRSLLPQKSSQPFQVALPSVPKHKKMPFVAGKVKGSSRSNSFSGSVALDETDLLFQSTSPSHSVHANVQSILHMMKHHQPWLCEQVSALHRPVRVVRRNLQGEFFSQSARKLREADRSAGSLYNLHLALQDELGHMTLCVSAFGTFLMCVQKFCDCFFYFIFSQ